MAVTVLETGRPNHYCDLPNWRRRRQLGLDFGCLIQCDCGQKWTWKAGYDSAYWAKVQ